MFAPLLPSLSLRSLSLSLCYSLVASGDLRVAFHCPIHFQPQSSQTVLLKAKSRLSEWARERVRETERASDWGKSEGERWKINELMTTNASTWRTFKSIDPSMTLLLDFKVNLRDYYSNFPFHWGIFYSAPLNIETN